MPLTGTPWTCSECGFAIAPHDDDWPRRFKQTIDRDKNSKSIENGYLHTVGVLRSDDEMEVEYRLLQPGEEWRQTMSDDLYCSPDLRWLAQMALEETCALLDCVLGEHSNCVSDEFLENLYEGNYISFKCPIAAAAIYLAETTGSITTFLSRTSCRGSGWNKKVFSYVELATRLVPIWLCRILIRDLVKSMLIEGIFKFTGTAMLHRNCLVWNEPAVPMAKYLMEKPEIAVIYPSVTQSDLDRAIEQADVWCPWRAGCRGGDAALDIS
jgi:hypothetical protein